MALAGLLVLIPHMRQPLLAFPELCQAFFALIGQVVELHPQEVARLPGEPELSDHAYASARACLADVRCRSFGCMA